MRYCICSGIVRDFSSHLPGGGWRTPSATIVALVVAWWAAAAPTHALAQDPDIDPRIELEGFVVTATPVPVPEGSLGSHVSVLDGETIRASGITQVVEALRSAPGVTIARVGSFGAQSSIFLRGGESDYVLVLLDGVPLNSPGGAIDLSGLTMENVERIEIVRGPVSGLYGSDAVAGVIQIITRGGSDGLSATTTLRGGSFGTTDGILEINGGSAGGSFSATLARYQTDGILELNNRHRNTVFSGRATLALGQASTARVTARLADRVYHFPTDGTGAPVDVNQSTFFEEATIGVELDRRFRESVEVRALVTLHDVDTGTDDPPDSPDDDGSFFSLDSMRRVAGDIRANVGLGDAGTLSAGVEFERAGLRSFNESTSSFGSFTGRSDDLRSNRALYLHGITAFGRWSGNAGVRFEDNEQFGGFTTFQVGSALSASESTRLRASAGRAIKEPSFFENFATGFVVGNPDLSPERSLSWEVGIDQRLAGGMSFGVTWFDQSFRDLIQYTSGPPEPGDPNYYNVAEADSRGLEAQLSAEIRGVSISASWTWLDTEVVDAGFDEGAGAAFVEGESLIRRPDHQGDLSGTGRIGSRVRWNASVAWVGERADRFFPPDFSPPEPVMLPSHTVVSAGVEVTVATASNDRPGFELILQGENLADATYEEAYGYAAPGRGLYVGGRVRWGPR